MAVVEVVDVVGVDVVGAIEVVGTVVVGAAVVVACVVVGTVVVGAAVVVDGAPSHVASQQLPEPATPPFASHCSALDFVEQRSTTGGHVELSAHAVTPSS